MFAMLYMAPVFWDHKTLANIKNSTEDEQFLGATCTIFVKIVQRDTKFWVQRFMVYGLASTAYKIKLRNAVMVWNWLVNESNRVIAYHFTLAPSSDTSTSNSTFSPTTVWTSSSSLVMVTGGSEDKRKVCRQTPTTVGYLVSRFMVLCNSPSAQRKYVNDQINTFQKQAVWYKSTLHNG